MNLVVTGALLFISVLLSGFVAVFIKPGNKIIIKLLLAFSGSYLFSISVLHLLPETYEADKSTGVFILLGFFLQIVLEFFSEGIEHGHIHVHRDEAKFPATILLSLCIHSFLEGMPVAFRASDSSITSAFVAGIILHNIPIALALMSMLMQSGVKKMNSMFILLVFALMAPLGMITSSLIGSGVVADLEGFFTKIMAVVLGIFLHISTTILFESSADHRFNIRKFITILAGFAVAWLSL
jgi:zinc and cadmium transporter